MNEKWEATIRRLESLPPGYEQNDPYEDVDISKLPEWWQSAIEEFEAYNLRPYRPARFRDGELVDLLITVLESELNIDLMFIGLNIDQEDKLDIRLNGDTICEVMYHRSPEGYSVYDIDSDEFRRLVVKRVD